MVTSCACVVCVNCSHVIVIIVVRVDFKGKREQIHNNDGVHGTVFAAQEFWIYFTNITTNSGDASYTTYNRHFPTGTNRLV